MYEIPNTNLPENLPSVPKNTAGIPMHDYQEYARHWILTHPGCGLFLTMGLGKACDDETLVPTPLGFRRLGDLKPDDVVFDRHGNPSSIEKTYHHVNKKSYQVTLEDGRSFICCDEHLMVIRSKYAKKEQVVPLSHILHTYRETSSAGRHSYPFSVPIAGPCQYPENPSAAEPYLTGTKCADGNCKRIPQENLIDSRNHRMELLHGLMDNAGRIERAKNKKAYTQCLCLPHASKELLHDISVLCWSVGIPVFRTKNGLELRTSELLITDLKKTEGLPDGIVCKEATHAAIVDIKPMPSRNMTCLTVDNLSHTYLINDYIVTHNTMTTLSALYDMNPTGHVLVIAPKNVARGTWQDEIDKWQLHLRTRSFVIDENTGKDLSRKKRLERYAEIQTAPSTVYFINRELVTDLVKNMPIINGRPVWYFPIVVADELQSFKSYKAERFKALKRVRPCISNFIGLTGTPTPEGLMDLWSQVYLMDMGQRLGKTITEYRNRWFHPTVYANGYPVKWEPNPGAEDEIYAAISDIVISMKTNLNLPPVTYNNIWAYLDKDEMELYKQFAKTQVFETDGVEITAVNAAVLQNKLSQMASGALYIDAKTHAYHKIHEKKLDLLEYVLGNTEPPVMVAYYFQSDLDMIQKRFPDAKVFDGTTQMTRDWNNKQIPMMLIQPSSSGRGSNLQFGGHTLVWYTLPWNLEDYLQCNARLYRQGQTEPTVIHHLMVHGTIDEKILKSIERKDMSQTALMDAVQAVVDLTFTQ